MKKVFIIVGLVIMLLGAYVVTNLTHNPQIDGYENIVGAWSSNNTTLQVFSQGRVSYKTEGEKTSYSLKAPMQSFGKENFSAGLLFLAKNFDYQLVDKDTLIVNQETLTRVNASDGHDTKAEIPSAEELKWLNLQTHTLLQRGMYLGTMKEMYDVHISQLWKNQISLSELNQELLPENIDAGKTFPPVLSEHVIITKEPVMQEEVGYNFLIIESFNSEVNLSVNASYLYEFPEWKLAKIHVKSTLEAN